MATSRQVVAINNMPSISPILYPKPPTTPALEARRDRGGKSQTKVRRRERNRKQEKTDRGSPYQKPQIDISIRS